MKTTILSLVLATVASVAFAADVVERTTTTTSTGGATVSATTSSGTITEYAPGTTFVLKESSGPVTYRYGHDVTYYYGGKVIEPGEVRTRIKVGAPVHVHYATEGHDRVISRVDLD